MCMMKAYFKVNVFIKVLKLLCKTCKNISKYVKNAIHSLLLTMTVLKINFIATMSVFLLITKKNEYWVILNKIYLCKINQ